ncbi:MAG: hypothetical protein SF182_25460, partial [Deltaproteobacteria bacterium]|nr:hypothetical protein [Deltaproteobacteria bacterium]
AKANVKRARASVLKAAVEGRLVPTEAALARAEGRDYEPASTLLARILTERKAAWSASGARGKYKEPVAPDGDRPPLLPEGWTSCSLDGLATKITSGSRDWSPHYGRGKGVFLLAQNVRRRRLDLSMCQMVDPPEDDPACVRSLVQRGDLLVTIVGANTGEACRVPVDLDRHYVCQSVALIRPAETAVSGFVELWLSSDPLLRIWDQYIYGQGRPHLSFDDLRRSPVWLPPLAEQHRIVAEVDRRLSVLDALDAALDTNLARCARLRQAVLKRAFEGRLVPSDGSGDSEPARNQAAN